MLGTLQAYVGGPSSMKVDASELRGLIAMTMSKRRLDMPSDSLAQNTLVEDWGQRRPSLCFTLLSLILTLLQLSLEWQQQVILHLHLLERLARFFSLFRIQ